MEASNVVIIGGGLSGLSAAYFLGRSGIRSTLVEKTNRLGGLIRTDVVGGCELEAGPDSYLAAKPAVTELAQELPDLRDQIIGSNDGSRRIFIARGGKLVPLPQGMVMMVPARLMPAITSPLFSFKTKLGFFAEMFRRPVERQEDVSVQQLVTDHFGEEVLRYVAEPLLSGVYGGDSAHLSAESVLPRFLGYELNGGSLIRGVRREYRKRSQNSLFLSFRHGMQTLTDSLARAAADYTEFLYAEADQVERSVHSWRVRVGGDWIEAKQLILACPAYVSAQLVASVAPSLASELAAIRYASAILINLVYDRSDLTHAADSFGFLVPRGERRTIAAATWVSTKFPTRTPSHLAALRAFIVEPEAKALLGLPSETLIELARTEFQRLLGIKAVPLFSAVQAWPNSMPQYEVGHRQRLERISTALHGCPDLYLAGNAFEGVGVPDCVRMAKETAKQIKTGN